MEPYADDSPLAARPNSYAYISLGLGRFRIQLRGGCWVYTEERHHVTLANLPGMGPHAMLRFHTDWSGMLDAWRSMRATPMERSSN
eukprot:6021540-Lingulodinium_polyedra.AAC.1